MTNFLNDLLHTVLLQNGSSKFITGDAENIVKSVSLGISVMGVFCILYALLPEAWRTYKVKNTVGINKLMFLLHSMVATFFFLGGVILIVNGSYAHVNNGWTIDVPLTGVVYTICNLFGMCSCWYTLLLKVKHSKAAASLGIAESDYFKEYISKGRG